MMHCIFFRILESLAKDNSLFTEVIGGIKIEASASPLPGGTCLLGGIRETAHIKSHECRTFSAYLHGLS